jgi:hypothetical protein
MISFLLQIPQDGIYDMNLFTKIMEYYNVEASHNDFMEFMNNRRIVTLDYTPIEYMVLYASKQKSRDDVANKRVTFLRFCVTNDIVFNEDIFMGYLEWSQDNCVDGKLNRWEKMERWLEEGVVEVM